MEQEGNQKQTESAAFPVSQKIYEADGKRYIVTRHFIGKRECKDLIFELAERQAGREFGLE